MKRTPKKIVSILSFVLLSMGGDRLSAAPSPHPLHTNGAANILFADGHVEYWKDTSVLADAKYSDKGADDPGNPVK